MALTGDPSIVLLYTNLYAALPAKVALVPDSRRVKFFLFWMYVIMVSDRYSFRDPMRKLFTSMSRFLENALIVM
jgi:hypothetical protein